MKTPHSRRRFAGAVAAILLSVATGASAEVPTVRVDDQIRILVADRDDGGERRITGRFVGMNDETLTFTDYYVREITVPLVDVVGLDVMTGLRGNSRTGALVGLAIGFAGGGALGVAIENDFGGGGDASGAFMQGGLLFGILGAGVGAVFGELMRSAVWEPVPCPWIVPTSRTGARAQETGLAWSFSF